MKVNDKRAKRWFVFLGCYLFCFLWFTFAWLEPALKVQPNGLIWLLVIELALGAIPIYLFYRFGRTKPSAQ